MSGLDFYALRNEAGSVFTPGSPVSERDLFAGRQEQVKRILNAVSQRGFHAVLYGDRGVGKTSLANVLLSFLTEYGNSVILLKANCDTGDDFSSIWRKVFQEITITNVQNGIGFTSSQWKTHQKFIDTLPRELKTDDVRRILANIGHSTNLVVAIDEFDRLENRAVAALMADTIKTISDTATPATILLIGVAESVDRLVEGHRSIERSLVQVHMPRMSDREIEEIVSKGVARLGMNIKQIPLREITRLSQGLPYVTHTLSLHSVQSSIDQNSTSITERSVKEGIQKSLEQWQQTIITAYYNATKSHQPDHLYKEVLLACALAETDEKNFFTAAAVRTPLRVIAARPDLDIPNFARHLKEFTETRRGNILIREGETRRFRYRFVNPLIRPYLMMRGVADGLLSPEKRKELHV